MEQGFDGELELDTWHCLILEEHSLFSQGQIYEAVKLKGDGKIEVTIHYVSDETLVQEDEVGNSYVFKKMSDSYPIPYVLWLESYCWKTGFYLLSFAKYGPRQSNHVNVVGVVSVQQ